MTLILGILGLTCICGFFGIPAIIVGHLELQAINQGRSSERNRTITKVGFILGIIATALGFLGLLAYFIFWLRNSLFILNHMN